MIRHDLAPEGSRGGDGCCPWCLGRRSDFVERATLACGHCGARIPTGADWYESGEKVVV